MRLIVIFAVILGAIAWGVLKIKRWYDESPLGRHGVTSSAFDPTAGKASPPASGGPSSGSSPSGTDSISAIKAGDPKDAEKPASRIYRFLHRQPPLPADLTTASNGCTFAIDPGTGSVLVCGPVSGVDTVCKYLEAIDLATGSCAVQSWAVYVDKSVQKGFDIVAALRAVGGHAQTTGLLGNGGLTLDIGADDLAVALQVICDGSVVEVIQRPHVQLQHGIDATIESLQEVPVPSTTVSQGIAQTSVEYRKVGLQLKITPYFLDGNRLRLSVAQSNGLIGQTVKVGENEVPIIQSQSVQTSVEMAIGQTVVLGGVSTLREKTVRGLLRNTREVSEGSLYVILSTYYDVPKAMPVQSPMIAPGASTAPLGPPMQDPGEWLNAELLPDLGWNADQQPAKSSKVHRLK